MSFAFCQEPVKHLPVCLSVSVCLSRSASDSKMKSFLSTLLLSGLAAGASQPNILFVLTDDQDKHMGSPDYMPQLQVR